MPQIRCPNCGLTINLENRKDTDIDMITTAVQHNAKTFTDLLRVTKLPRKTLSLRLKEMCEGGVLAKSEGMYVINGASRPERKIVNPLTRFSGAIQDKRMKSFIMLGLLLVAFPAVSYVLATLVMLPNTTPAPQGPVVLGNFTAAVKVSDVSDLWSWQAQISFNATELTVLEVESGDFLHAEYPFFAKYVDEDGGLLLVGSTLKAGDVGVNGSGDLAVIVFGYYVDSYGKPQVVPAAGGFETKLLDSHQAEILGPALGLVFP